MDIRQRVMQILIALIIHYGSPQAFAFTDWYVDANAAPFCGSGGPTDPACRITDAVRAAAPGDTIYIAPATYHESITVDKNLSLKSTGDSNNTIIQALFSSAVIVTENVTASLENLTLTSGYVTNSGGGGLLTKPGSIVNVLDCNVSGNVSRGLNVFFPARAAGISVNKSTVTLMRCIVENNDTTALESDFIFWALGSGIEVLGGTLNAFDTTIRNNFAKAIAQNGIGGLLAQGAGLYVSGGGYALLERCTVADNLASVDTDYVTGTSANGGGIFVTNGGHVDFLQCTVSGNTAEAVAAGATSGGGIGASGTTSTLFLQNTTISGNQSSMSGGGIATGVAQITLENCTVANNAATTGGGLHQSAVGTIQLHNTIVANNTATSGPDCNGTIISTAYNFIGNSADCTIIGDLTGLLIDMDPLLSPLANNGGVTLTHELLSGSPAIDAGDPNPGQCPALDQRGIIRPGDGNCDGIVVCDLGSVETSAASWHNYGSGWPGTLGIPQFTANANPRIGIPFVVDLQNSRGINTIAFIVIGFAATNLPTHLGGNLLATPDLVLPIPLSGNGMNFTMIFSDPSLCNVSLYLQAIEIDPNASAGFSFTPGVQLDIDS